MDRHLTNTVIIVSATVAALLALGSVAAWYATKSALITLLCTMWFIAGALSYAFAMGVYTLREGESEDIEEIEIVESDDVEMQ